MISVDLYISRYDKDVFITYSKYISVILSFISGTFLTKYPIKGVNANPINKTDTLMIR